MQIYNFFFLVTTQIYVISEQLYNFLYASVL